MFWISATHNCKNKDLHLTISELVFEAKKNFLLEKPIAITVDSARKIH